jgi:signal peptidase I
MTDLRPLRIALRASWLGLAVGAVVLAAAANLTPLIGYRLVVIEGRSMVPSLSLGSIAVERTDGALSPAFGQVVTIRLENGTRVTHRIIGVSTGADGSTLVLTKGDANPDPDPTPVPATRVEGVMVDAITGLGYLFAFIAMPSGILAVLSALAASLCADWLLEDLELERLEPAAAPGPDSIPDGVPA